MKRKQKKHIRTSKKGKKFLAGKRKKAAPCKVNAKIKRQIVREQMEQVATDLKRKGRARLPEIGILRIKVKRARPARWGINPFTKQRMRFKAKPRTKVVKFRAAKALKEAI